MHNYTCSYDSIKIYAPFLPYGPALSSMSFRQCSDQELTYIKSKRYAKVVYRYVAKGNGCTLLYEPCLKSPFIKEVPVSILSFNAGGMSPEEIAYLVYGIFGTLEGLTVAYIEARIDFYDTDFNIMAKMLLVERKKHINDTYSGQMVYFGVAASGHQVILYDKEL